MVRESVVVIAPDRRTGLIVRVRGVVQGVGFRPFIYRLAHEHGLTGSVANTPEGVVIRIAGAESDLDQFVREIRTRHPPLARITALEAEAGPLTATSDFVIDQSGRGEHATVLIPPDVSVCAACLRELFDPADRRYRYPFINCTDCGPRYTIIRGVPYDRPLTTMAPFEMCAACRAEYADPFDRRFHAEPVACPVCGPRLSLTDESGRESPCGDPIAEVVRRILAGDILAIKGIGGFHLAVDATNDAAVRRLRQRKHREEKPLALMAASLQQVRRFCHVSEAEAELLTSAEKPIVLLDKRADCRIAPSVAPGQVTLGVMLPYTPLHALLLDSPLVAIVLTSGNLSEEPIAYRNDEALERLADIADAFLLHDREIYRRADDSVARVVTGAPTLLRRARGFAPRPVLLAREVPSLVAVGGQLKNTICLTRGREAFLSPHIGDLDNLETFDAFKSTVAHLSDTLEVRPTAVAYDLHPDYLSTRWALEQSQLPAFGVQHHHAHLAAVLAEQGLEGPAVGIILDGSGYGTDGRIWGGEILVGDLGEFRRAARFPYIPLLGGEAAVREPWRVALAWLDRLFGEGLFSLPIPFVKTLEDRRARVLLDVQRAGIAQPRASSCGRLFDAVAALCGLRSRASYEGQAALELEGAAEQWGRHQDEVDRSAAGRDGDVIAVDAVVRAVVAEIACGVEVGEIAARFHARLAHVLAAAASEIAAESDLHEVVLGGGCFQNRLLTTTLVNALEARGLHTRLAAEVPTNDGGLALGQAAIVAARLRASAYGDP